MSQLRAKLARGITPVVLANLTTHYPYHDAHWTKSGEAPHDPIATHPAFGNSFDWHSSVHSHWTAVQLMDYFAASNIEKPDELPPLENAVAKNLCPANIKAEKLYLEGNRFYERPYGWAWAMMLASAAHESKHPAIHESAAPLRALSEFIASAALNWLNVLPFPVRHGVHANTAFALRLMHRAARTLGFTELEAAIATHTRTWFGNDRNWPAHFERSGNDFLSPGLTTADLMRQILQRDEFAGWWTEFLPALSSESAILAAVQLPDVSDAQVVHLHGLNLSRAGVLARIAETLQQHALHERARSLYETSAARAIDGYYSETHWLPTFAWEAALSLDNAS